MCMMHRGDVEFLVKMSAYLDYLKVTFICKIQVNFELLRILKDFYLIFNKDLEEILRLVIVQGG